MKREKTKYINLLTDTGFKIAFGTQHQSEEILKGFLNALYSDTPGFEPIEKLWYESTEKSRKNMGGKTIIHDVTCQTCSGRKFILEMQRGRKDDFIFRSTYYTFRGITDQIDFTGKGTTKFKYLPVTAVYICDFNIKQVRPKLVSHFILKDEDTNEVLTYNVRSTYLQLPQFNKRWEDCTTYFDQWIFILKNMHKLKEFPTLTRKDEVFSRLEKVASYAALSEEDRIAYEADLKWASDFEEVVATAKREAAEEGRAEGIAEGRAEGIAEGRAEGIAEGRAEGIAEGMAQALWEVALRMWNNGNEIDQISQTTGLPVDELSKRFG